MIMNMTTDYRDPLLDLFGTESNSGNETSSPSDIQLSTEVAHLISNNLAPC